MITSISSDAHYAITTDDKDYAILWDLQKHTKKILSRDANAYSAYWIKNTSYYMWQNWKTKVIHVTDVNTGQDIKIFHPDFIVFGEAMSSDLKYNVASDKSWNIWVGEGHILKLLAAHYNYSPGFYNKIINFTFMGNNELITSGFGDYDEDSLEDSIGIDLWNLVTRKSIRRFLGNQVETFATISPDGKYVVAGDANAGNIFVWERETGKRLYRAANLYSGLAVTHSREEIKKWTDVNTKLIPVPQEFDYDNAGLGIESIKFIDNEHYLVFYQNSHFAVLFSVQNP